MIVALLCSVVSWAQTWHNLTSKLTNPSFESGNLTGWTVIGEDAVPASGVYAKDSEDYAVFNENGGEAADGDYVFKLKQWWCNRTAVYQTTPVRLPAGTYRLTANLQNKEEGKGVPGNYELGYIKGSVSASNAPLSFTASTSGSFAQAMHGTIITKEFTLSETTDVTFAAQSAVWGGHHFQADDFKLYSYAEDYTYKLKNTGFESDATATGDVSGYNAPSNWTIVAAEHGGAGIATYGSSYKVSNQAMPASSGSEYGNNGFMFRVAWRGTSCIYQEVTLPAGYYELGYSAQAIFADSKKTILKSTVGFYISSESKGVYGQVQDLSNTSMSYGHVGINLTEETTVQVRIGYQAQGYELDHSTSVVFDNITLVRYESEQEALAAASTSLPIDISYKLKGDALTSSTWRRDSGTSTNWSTTKNVNSTSSDYYWGSDNSTGDANYFEAWISDGSKQAGRLFYQSIDNVYAGSYCFRAAAMANTTSTGVDLYVGDGTTTVNPGNAVGRFYNATGSISNYPLELGLKQDAATTNWFAIAQTGLFFKGVTLEALKTQFNTLKAILSDDDYECVTGSERTTLEDIANDTYEDDKVTYMGAIDAIISATATFKAAKANYDKFDDEKDRALAIGVDAGDIVRPVSGSKEDLTTALRALYVLEDAAATSGYTVNATDIFGSWEPQNTESTSGQHWSGDGRSYIDKWDGAGFTMSVKNEVTLPAGKYVFKAAARAALNGVWDDALTMQVTGESNAIFDPQGDSGKGIDTSGAANYGDGTFANNGVGRGWEWRFIPFTLAAESEVTMKVEAIVKGGNWASFSDITLLTTDDNIGICQRLWSAAKAAAIAARDNGDYAIVTGKERTDLIAVITEAGTEPETSSEYQTQTAALNNSRNTFIAAKDTYDEYAQESVVATALGVSVPSITSSTTVSTLISNMQTMNVSEYTAATTSYTFDATDLLGDWSNAPGNNHGESWDGTTGDGSDEYYDLYNAAERAMTQTVTLPKASYVLVAKGRASTNGRLTLSDGTNTITFPHKSSTGKGITTAGAASFSEGTFANENNGRGWEYRFLTFESDGSTSTTLTFNWTTASSNWAGLDDITLLAIPETVELDEDDEYTPVYTIANVTLSRSIAANTWSTFVVPFDIDNTTLEDQFGDDVRVSTFSADDKNGVTFTPMVEPAIEANVPVLLRTTAAKSSFTFNGVTIKEGTTTVIQNGVNFVGNYAGEITIPNTLDTYYVKSNALKKSTGTQKLKGFRAYFTVDADSPVKAFFENGFNFDDAVGIKAIDNGQLTIDNAEIFNLAGQKMSKLQKGVNIVNGKKVLVK